MLCKSNRLDCTLAIVIVDWSLVDKAIFIVFMVVQAIIFAGIISRVVVDLHGFMELLASLLAAVTVTASSTQPICIVLVRQPAWWLG